MIFLTGFGPYGKNTVNISGEIVKNLEVSNFGFPLVKKVFPVIWDLSVNSLRNMITQVKSDPKLVILLGIHESKKFQIEKFAWNFIFGKDTQNKYKFGMIKYDSPLVLKTILNLNKLYSHLQLRKKKDILISFYPGIYLCNYIYYWALLISEKKYPVVFVHIPYKIDLNIGIKMVEKLIETIISTHSNMN